MILIIAIGLIFLSAISKGFGDRKAFKEGGVESSNGRGWLMKVPFSFLLGKWHFFDMLKVVSLCIALTLYTKSDWYAVIIFYIIHGIIFETTYNLKG